ncbi:glycosyltransferase family 39 protein [Salinilacihabitans rarus]|uniref:DUF7846 domain-containing protein n=1 Tax=Salinilacihabitans rarus TaxID=2961596 RepID=UPI0020C83F82|nr:glycosyltransferase family 39 protein [Salinilacihabitans rarus]
MAPSDPRPRPLARLRRSVRRSVRRARDPPGRDRAYAAAVAVLAGLAVFLLATELFPYHSNNDDEAVYLLQAAMLLDGQLELHAGDLAGAFRPWFFVADGGRLYPKYAPVPAATYAVSMALFGEPRVTLALVAAGNAALVYVLGATAFDRRVGVVAAALFAASPMTLLTSSVFLPYAPTTLLNLAFAVCYLRGVREGSLPSAAAAGVVVGLAFFARPYTAVLFAAPFVCHALWTVGRSLRREGVRPLPDPVRRNALTAAGGLAFVGVALAYNARLTGSPLLFPYEAFAPLDGPGFGRRRILGHSIEYTPELALRANGYALRYLATRWVAAGALGTLAALCGLAVAARRWRRGRDGRNPAPVLLAGLLVSVPVGNVPFWGNYNVLATLSDPTDGLVAQFGPFYHFDLLAPLSIFAALALVTGWRTLPDRLAARTSPGAARRVAIAALVASALVLGGANAAAVAAPLERNAAHTERFEAAYEPFEETDLDDALVFLPTPYGPWQNHPFQPLRNDPDLDGEVVYALDRGPAGDFAVLDAYPDRTVYRYAYRGEWTPNPHDRVVPTLEPLAVREGASLAGETTVAVPDRVSRATVRLETDAGYATYGIDDPGETVAVDWALEPGEARLETPDGAAAVPANGTDEVALSVTVVQPDGSSATYRQVATVRTTDDGVEAVWPPERTVCTLVTACGSEGTYLPDDPEANPAWAEFETRLEER